MKTLKTKLATLTLAVVTGAFAQSSIASLIGDTININAQHGVPSICATYESTSVVGAGIELGTGDQTGGGCNGGVSVDVSASGFALTGFHFPFTYADYLFSEIVLSDLDWVGSPGAIVGVAFLGDLSDLFHLPGEGNAVALPIMNLGWTANSVTVTFTEGPGGFQVFEYRDGGVGSFRIDAVHVSVPEPSIVALLGLALTGLGLARRRRLVN